MLPRRENVPLRLFFLVVVIGQVLAFSAALAQQDDVSAQPGTTTATDAEDAAKFQALTDLTRAIQADPHNAQNYFKRAFFYMEMAKDDQAMSDLTDAIRINPRFAQAYFRRAFVYMLKGDYPHAAADLDQAIQLNPRIPKAYYRRANVHMMMGAYDSAIADLNELIARDPAYEEAYPKRCFIYMLKGDYGHAIAALNQMIADHPQNVLAHNQLAWLLATCPQQSFRDGKKAVENATTACDLTGWKTPEQLDVLAAACAESGDFVNAMKWENQAISTQSNPDLLAAQKSRLALYQSYHPYHVDKYVPQLQAVVE